MKSPLVLGFIVALAVAGPLGAASSSASSAGDSAGGSPFAAGSATRSTPLGGEGDVDGDVDGENPLAAVARQASRQALAPTPATQDKAAAGAVPSAPTGGTSANAKASPATVPAPPNSALPASAPLLPPLPATVQASVSQMGPVDEVFEATPLDDVVRTLSPYLGKPVNLSVQHSYPVTGTWHGYAAADVLREVTSSFGLRLRQTDDAFIIDEPGRAITVDSATLRPPAVEPAAMQIPAAMFQSPVVQVKPLPVKQQIKVLRSLDRETRDLLRARAQLRQQAGL